MEIKWIKVTTDIFDDEKILLIESMPDAYAIIVAWFKLLCLAGKQNNGGVFVLNDKIPYTDEMLATIMRMPVNTVRLALDTFERFGMVQIVNGAVTIPNWKKHQSFLDKNEYMREYMKEYRAKGRLTDGCKTNVKVNVNQMLDDKNKKKEERNKKENNSIGRFTPPSVSEVAEYCKSRGNEIDPEEFVSFYESKGWMVGKNKMKDWKAAVRTWEKSHARESQPKKSKLDELWGDDE